METADEIDALYDLPLDGFTAARNDLARRLRAEGRRDEAATVAGLRKPSAAAWVVNRLVRAHRDDVDALLEAAGTIRAGDHAADTAFRDAVDRLVRASRELVASSGRKPSDALLREVATTLRALAATAPEELVAGRLTEGREASGFADALAQSASSPPRRARTPSARKHPPTVDRARVEAARRGLAAARAELRSRERAAAAAEREAARARESVERAVQAVADAQGELDEARAGAHRRSRATGVATGLDG